MKVATLALIVRDGHVLLGHKKKGEIGTGTLNGPGGKVEDGESIVDCVIRETTEEVGVVLHLQALEKVAVVTSHVAGIPDVEVHVFRTEQWTGEPRETDDMVPDWYPVGELPSGQMLEGDELWWPDALAGVKFCANVYFRERVAGFESIEFLPFCSCSQTSLGVCR